MVSIYIPCIVWLSNSLWLWNYKFLNHSFFAYGSAINIQYIFTYFQFSWVLCFKLHTKATITIHGDLLSSTRTTHPKSKLSYILARIGALGALYQQKGSGRGVTQRVTAHGCAYRKPLFRMEGSFHWMNGFRPLTWKRHWKLRCTGLEVNQVVMNTLPLASFPVPPFTSLAVQKLGGVRGTRIRYKVGQGYISANIYTKTIRNVRTKLHSSIFSPLLQEIGTYNQDC